MRKKFTQTSKTEMLSSKPKIGLTWEPNLTMFKSAGTTATSSTKSMPQIPKPKTELIDGIYVSPADPKLRNKLVRKQLKDTTGKNWFDMPAQTITPEIKNDFQIIKLRNVIDPKRHYKKGDSNSKELPKYFQMGTVVESQTDFYSGRLTKKERKRSIAEELLHDAALGKYRKHKVREIEERNNVPGVEKWKIKGKQSWKRAKHRRGD
ncbi:hypothetical protein MKW98_009329 [Papaver atlanticum]|uniref:Fcf2 pre-rRNA processing C-terminal domain-containing protein n=1 Tax=Papaver atlanticum TaxID=357466 RepID=A0AAD4RZ02_9MAGN|nr:hypothetical protein MKW98_009329 [Papaver atlanticum]